MRLDSCDCLTCSAVSTEPLLWAPAVGRLPSDWGVLAALPAGPAGGEGGVAELLKACDCEQILDLCAVQKCRVRGEPRGAWWARGPGCGPFAASPCFLLLLSRNFMLFM